MCCLVCLYYKCMMMIPQIQVYVLKYLIDAIYNHVAIGLTHIVIVLPYLVFTTVSSCCILLLSCLMLVIVPCMCSCLLSGGLFFGCCSLCVHQVLLILLWTVLFEYDTGLFLMCFQDSIQWISLSVCISCVLVSYVSICCYRCQLDMSSVACDSPASCCELHCV